VAPKVALPPVSCGDYVEIFQKPDFSFLATVYDPEFSGGWQMKLGKQFV